MSRLTLSLACGDYDRTRALRDGTVVPEGIELNYLTLGPEEIFWRMLRHHEFDISEMSLSSYVLGRAQGELPFSAIAVFPSRSFRHSGIFVNADAGISHPADLVGRRVGVPEYQLTAAVWARGILKDEYGVAPEQIHWVTGGQEEPDREEKLALNLPGELHVERAPAGRSLNELLLSGEIAGLVTPRLPSSFTRGDERVRRLFPDFRTVEQDYFRRTGIFPIMHTVVIKREILDRHPWVAQSLAKAFTEAKDLSYQNLYDSASLRYVLPWLVADVEEMRALMGEDPWTYGLEPNRQTLETLIGYSFDQGLISRRPALSELFVPSTVEVFKV